MIAILFHDILTNTSLSFIIMRQVQDSPVHIDTQSISFVYLPMPVFQPIALQAVERHHPRLKIKKSFSLCLNKGHLGRSSNNQFFYRR